MPILKNCIIKEDEKEDIVTTEIIVDEEVEEVIKEENVVNAKEVTLDWQNILKNETKFNVDIDKLKNEKLNFKLNKNII